MTFWQALLGLFAIYVLGSWLGLGIWGFVAAIGIVTGSYLILSGMMYWED